MALTEKKVLFLIGPGFEELEFYVPYMRMQEAHAQVVVAGEKPGISYPGKHGTGINATADISFEAVEPGQFDAVIVPGGWAPDRIRRSEAVKLIVKTMYDDGKVIGLICHAGLVGISAGIVRGHNATGSEGIKDDLLNAGATWRDEPAFRSGNIIWGRVVEDIPDFCRELVMALQE